MGHPGEDKKKGEEEDSVDDRMMLGEFHSSRREVFVAIGLAHAEKAREHIDR